MTTALVVWGVLLKVALAWALWSRRRWQHRAWALDVAHDELVEETRAIRTDLLANRAGREAQIAARCVLAERALAEIAATITRRPPRRRWLALSRRVAKLAGAAAAVLLLHACTRAQAAAPPGGIVVTLDTPAPGDTARYIVTWGAAVIGPNQAPIGQYHVRLVRAGTDSLVLHQVAGTRTVDTLFTPRPLTFTDSIGPVKVNVTSVDALGQKSAPVSTGTWWIKRKPVPPSPPGAPTITDSSLAVVSVTIRPAVVAVSPGAVVQFCAFYTLADSSRGIFDNSQAVPGCLDLYTRWLAERAA